MPTDQSKPFCDACLGSPDETDMKPCEDVNCGSSRPKPLVFPTQEYPKFYQ